MLTMRVWASSLLLGLLSFAPIVEAVLDKPSLFGATNALLDDFEDGLKLNLPKAVIKETVAWNPGWMLDDCKIVADRHNFSVMDIEVTNVYYEDCVSPWMLCHHKDSPDPAWHFFEYFGRIPVRARSHVKGMISLPSVPSNTYGQYQDGFVTIFGQRPASRSKDWSHLSIMLHEVGHGLDLTAYADRPLSLSKNWENAYNQDSKVPDDYAKMNFPEDLAQNTIIATFDINVPGGLRNIPGDHDWSSIQHQYELLKKEQGEAGGVLQPGGTCTARIENSQPVKIPTKKTRGTTRQKSLSSDLDLEDELDTDEPVYYTPKFYELIDAGSKVKRTRMPKGKPNVELAKGLKIIHLPKNVSSEVTCSGY